MADQERPDTAQGSGEPSRRVGWRAKLLHPASWVVVTFLLSQVLEKLVTLIEPDAIERLRRLNEQAIAGVRAVQPWHGAALFWEKLTTNWPDHLTPVGIPFFLFGRAIGGGMEVIFRPLADVETAIPALIGYGLGFFIVWMLHEQAGREVNFFVGIVGTIFVGCFCLMLLQATMLLATGLFGLLLGTVSGGVGVLASIPIPLGWEFAKHLLENQAEARLEAAIRGKEAPPGTGATGA